MQLSRLFVLSAQAAVLSIAGCGLPPAKPAATHIREEAPARVTGEAPQVEEVPPLPKPTASAPPETYSVVVSNVRVQDLLFALARDARLNADIHPDVAGTVTMNAVEQTLPQLLARIGRQADIRYDIKGQNLVVMRDTPFLKPYRVDYVSAERKVEMNSSLSTQFGSSTGGGSAGVSTGTTGSTVKVDIKSNNRLWDTIVENVKDILQETDKVLPPEASEAVGGRQGGRRTPGQAAPQAQSTATGARTDSEDAASPATRFREAASVIANRESGTLYVRATSRQHEKVQEFLDQVMASVRQQVLIEVTVAEVGLNDEYQRGINWDAVRTTSGGTLTATQTSTATGLLSLGYTRASGTFSGLLNLMESFGTVRVLSSPKLSVLNNQTALLRVTKDLVYFTLTPQQISIGGGGGGGSTVNVTPTFTSTPNIAAEGFMMGVLPQIGEGDSIVLNVRPTIRRRVEDKKDPNPELAKNNIENAIPVFETREFESILRVQSGQIAVLGGLMQDVTESVDSGVPLLGDIPVLGWFFRQTKQVTRKTELVIFLRPTVIRDPGTDGDFARFREHLPTGDFFAKPDAARQPTAR